MIILITIVIIVMMILLLLLIMSSSSSYYYCNNNNCYYYVGEGQAGCASNRTGGNYCTPEIDTSEKSSWIFGGMSQWTFSGIFPRLVTFQWIF